MGAPFWSWNSKNKRCHLKVTNSDPRALSWMWSGNTDASCAYPTGCPSKSKEYRLTVHATDKKKGYLKDLIYRFKINVFLTFKKSFCWHISHFNDDLLIHQKLLFFYSFALQVYLNCFFSLGEGFQKMAFAMKKRGLACHQRILKMILKKKTFRIIPWSEELSKSWFFLQNQVRIDVAVK